eukprot:GHVS01028471.1.p1 GENE.GHVS01028471.1~~GHVS01028471.1.p1  ORF type:complete len:256 (-),score=25.67 GHVS01028471.1:251-1018(-)
MDRLGPTSISPLRQQLLLSAKHGPLPQGVPFRGPDIGGGPCHKSSLPDETKKKQVTSSPPPLVSSAGNSKGGVHKSAEDTNAVYLYGALHGALDQLLPASYHAISQSMHFSPTILGAASSCHRLAHVAMCLVWGVALDLRSVSAKYLMALSCFVWAVAIALLACIQWQWQLWPLMLLLGAFMATMPPLTQKLLAEGAKEQERGTRFGCLMFGQSFGRMLTLLFATGIGGMALGVLQVRLRHPHLYMSSVSPLWLC